MSENQLEVIQAGKRVFGVGGWYPGRGDYLFERMCGRTCDILATTGPEGSVLMEEILR